MELPHGADIVGTGNACIFAAAEGVDGDVELADLPHPTKMNIASVPSVTRTQDAVTALLNSFILLPHHALP